MVRRDQWQTAVRDRARGLGGSAVSWAGWRSQLLVHALVSTVAVVVLSMPVAAQDFCQDQGGQFMGYAVDSGGSIVVTAMFLGLLGGVAARSFNIKWLGNAIIGSVFVAAIALVFGVMFLDVTLSFVPNLGMGAMCGGFGGGGGG